jgi:TetR/AcrR family transcriptional regulator, mexJK operon transcriptional repressor
MNQDKNTEEKKRGRPFDPSKISLVVTTAKKMFSENGFERTTLDAISKASGVTKKTIYSHFNSKEALFGATVLDRVKEEFSINSADLDEHQPMLGLTMIANQFLGLIRRDEVLGAHRTMFSCAASHPKLCDTFYQNAPFRIHAEVSAYLAQCKTLNIHNPQLAADQFLSLFLGLDHIKCMLGFEKPNQLQDEALIRENVTFFMAAYS